MKRAQIVPHIASQGAMAKGTADAAVSAVLALISEALAHAGDVAVAGSGSFARPERLTREDHNPRAGEPIAIGTSSGLPFKAVGAVQDALNCFRNIRRAPDTGQDELTPESKYCRKRATGSVADKIAGQIVSSQEFKIVDLIGWQCSYWSVLAAPPAAFLRVDYWKKDIGYANNKLP